MRLATKGINLGILFLVAIMLGGCAASSQYLRPEQTKRVYNVPYDQVFSVAPTAVSKAKMVFIEARKEDGVIDVVAPPSFWTSSLGNLMQGGDKVTVVVTKLSDTQTSIDVTSQSRGDLVDLGRSARVVSTLLNSFDQVL